MNRCLSENTPRARLIRLVAPAALLATLTLAHVGLSAQVVNRPFPPNVMRGILTVTQPPEVLMNGKPDRLSPGARIRGANNMLMMSGAMVGQAMLVNYTREPTGYIHDVWILTEAEARQPVLAQR